MISQNTMQCSGAKGTKNARQPSVPLQKSPASLLKPAGKTIPRAPAILSKRMSAQNKTRSSPAPRKKMKILESKTTNSTLQFLLGTNEPRTVETVKTYPNKTKTLSIQTETSAGETEETASRKTETVSTSMVDEDKKAHKNSETVSIESKQTSAANKRFTAKTVPNEIRKRSPAETGTAAVQSEFNNCTETAISDVPNHDAQIESDVTNGIKAGDPCETEAMVPTPTESANNCLPQQQNQGKGVPYTYV